MKSIQVLLLTIFLVLHSGLAFSSENSLHLDGQNDRINCGNKSAISITGNKITIEAWIYAEKWDSLSFLGHVIDNSAIASKGGYTLRVGAGILEFVLGNGTAWSVVSTPSVLTLNNWHHIAGVYNGSRIYTYIDGIVQDSTATSINIANSGTNLTLGDFAGGGRNFKGKLEEVRIWKVARTPSEIYASKDIHVCSKETGLKAYYRFNQGEAGDTNTTVTALSDITPNGNQGTLSGFTLMGNSSNWISGLALPYVYNSGVNTVYGCAGFSMTVGNNTYSSTGIYTDTLIGGSVLGCDSIVITNLTVFDTVDVSTSISGSTFSANATGVNYLWIDCNNSNTPVPGQIYKDFTPNSNGSYAVVVIDSMCADTSFCMDINWLEVSSIEEGGFSVYPNPGNGHYRISFARNQVPAAVELLNVYGQMIFEFKTNNEFNIDLNLEVPKGIYFLRYRYDKRLYSRRLIVN